MLYFSIVYFDRGVVEAFRGLDDNSSAEAVRTSAIFEPGGRGCHNDLGLLSYNGGAGAFLALSNHQRAAITNKVSWSCPEKRCHKQNGQAGKVCTRGGW